MRALSFAVALSLSSSVFADNLRSDLRIDAPLAATAAAAWIGSELLKSHFAPARCRWCDRNADGSDALNPLDAGVRGALRWNNVGAADTLSNVMAFGVAPIFSMGFEALVAAHDDALTNVPVDLILIAEAVALAQDANQITKFMVGRERPFVHALTPDARANTAQPSDNNLSFYSGHATFTFALAAAAGTIAHLRGYRLWRWVLASGFVAATATAYLRIGADKHYFTDVTTGALLGSAFGFAVPMLAHGTNEPTALTRPLLVPNVGGATLAWLF